MKTTSTTTATKKKGKPRVVKEKIDEVGKVHIEENKRDNDGEVAEEVVMVMERDEWPCFFCAVVEQLSWGTCWSPFWDINLMGEASHAFFSDVAWDDDIWDLKDIKDSPTP